MSDGIKSLTVVDFEFGELETDVVVVRLRHSDELTLSETRDAPLLLAQEAIFAGFPLSLTSVSEGVFANRPIPIAKKGALSASIQRSFNGDPNKAPHTQLLFDAHNNMGYSGSPVFVSMNPLSANLTLEEEVTIVAIVSGFIYDRPLDGAEKLKPNSGFMVATPFSYARKAADRLMDRLS